MNEYANKKELSHVKFARPFEAHYIPGDGLIGGVNVYMVVISDGSCLSCSRAQGDR